MSKQKLEQELLYNKKIRKEKEISKSLTLQIGEEITLRGSFNSRKKGEFIQDDWVGTEFFSHSEGSQAEFVFVPKGMTVIVTRVKHGSPLSFSRITLKRLE